MPLPARSPIPGLHHLFPLSLSPFRSDRVGSEYPEYTRFDHPPYYIDRQRYHDPWSDSGFPSICWQNDDTHPG